VVRGVAGPHQTSPAGLPRVLVVIDLDVEGLAGVGMVVVVGGGAAGGGAVDPGSAAGIAGYRVEATGGGRSGFRVVSKSWCLSSVMVGCPSARSSGRCCGGVVGVGRSARAGRCGARC
jgi:hypothetical protein